MHFVSGADVLVAIHTASQIYCLVAPILHAGCPLNKALVNGLPATKQATLKTTQKLAAHYRYNKSMPDVWQQLISSVQQEGSLAGMLRLKAGPPLRTGYKLTAPAEGCDLQHAALSSATAQQLMEQLRAAGPCSPAEAVWPLASSAQPPSAAADHSRPALC